MDEYTPETWLSQRVAPCVIDVLGCRTLNVRLYQMLITPSFRVSNNRRKYHLLLYLRRYNLRA